jgi:hypothetical protein
MSQEVTLADIDLIQVECIELFGLVAGLGVPRGVSWVGADSINVQSKCCIFHSFVRLLICMSNGSCTIEVISGTIAQSEESGTDIA